MRFQLDEERAPLLGQGDVIVNRKGRIGCDELINSEGRLVGLGYEPAERDNVAGVYREATRPGDELALRNPSTLQDRIQLPEDITVIQRP